MPELLVTAHMSTRTILILVSVTIVVLLGFLMLDPNLMLERDERENEEKLIALRAAIDKGLASGVAKPGTFQRIRKKLGLPETEP